MDWGKLKRDAQGAGGEEAGGNGSGGGRRGGEHAGEGGNEARRSVGVGGAYGSAPAFEAENSFLAVNLVQRMKDSYAHRRPHRGPDRERREGGDV